jgi:hypothetical protein
LGEIDGVGGKLAKSGATEFIKLDDAPKPTLFLTLEAEQFAKPADEAAEQGAKSSRKRTAEHVTKTIGKESTEMFV